MTKIGIFRKLLQEAVDIARSYGLDITIETVMEKWNEPHRYWHTPNHLYEMLDGIKDLYEDKKINEKEYHILVIAAIFHDIVYDTKRKDNEEKSVEYMMSLFDADYSENQDIKKICDIIIGTKTHDSKDGLNKKFNKLDTFILDSSFIDMLDWENKIYKEYKWVGWKQYKKGRIEFLLGTIKEHSYNVLNIKNLIDYINKKVPKVGICYYEIDKLPPINKYIENNNKINSLFDIITIVIIYNKNTYNKEKIKEYSVCADYEFVALSEDSFVGYISKQQGDVSVVKDLKLSEYYNKDIENRIKDKSFFIFF